MPTALADLLRHHRDVDAHHPFVVGARTGTTVTYGDMAALVANEELTQGVEPGSRLAVAIADPVTFVQVMVALLARDYAVAPLDAALGTEDPDHLRRRAKALGCRGLLTATGELPSLHLETLTPSNAATGGGIVLASSGTTGTPKVMRLSLPQLMTAARTIADHHELSPDDRGFNPLPLFHINAEVVGVLASLSARATLIVDDRFHRTRFWNLVDERGATWINAVPAIIHRLLPLRDGETVPSRVRFIRSASAPLPASLLAEFQRVTGLAVLESYGMTEGASQICANPLHGPRKPGSVGVPVGVSLRIIDAAGHECRDHEVGQVTIQGPSIIDHYESPGYDDRFRDGWLLTGDLGYRDDDGYIFLVGRTDDVINRGGEKIMPREIEEVIGHVDGVTGVVVVGESDDVFGQVPVAYLECDGVASTADAERARDVLTRCAHDVVTHFPRGRRPARLQLVAALPRHATGKIQRGVVRTGGLVSLFAEEIA